MRNTITYILIAFLLISAGNNKLLLSQNNPAVRPVLTRPQQQQPNSKEQLAMKYYREKKYDKAAELFRQLYGKKPTTYYYNYLYRCYISLNRYGDAERLARQQRKKYSNSYRVIIDEAHAAELGGNKKKANRILSKLLDDLPIDRNQVLQITNGLISKGYSDLAVKVYKEVESKQNNYSYSFELANAYMYSGDYSRMFNSYLDHLEKVPTDMQRVKSRLQMVMRMDVNSNLSEMLKRKLLQRSQADPDNTAMADLLMWYSLQVKDFEMAFRQARSIDVRFGNGDQEMLELANIAYSNYDYAIAAEAFDYVRKKKTSTPYFVDAWVGYYLSLCSAAEDNPKTEIQTYEDLEKQGVEAIKELGINNITSDIILKLSRISAFKLNKQKEAAEMLETALANPSVNKKKEAELKIALADVLLSNDKIWDATLLYSQVENDMKNEPIGHEAKLKNARVFYYVGEFDWAATRLDVLKSATSKLISNDAIELSLFIKEMRDEDTLGFTLRKFAGADLYSYQGKYDSALILLDKIENEPMGYTSKEYALFKKGQILAELNKYTEADSVYNKLVVTYPWSIKADNALYERGEILRNMGKTSEAMDLYLKLMTEFPESIYAGKARKRYRMLEGSNAVDEL